jgi:hypothetical protein
MLEIDINFETVGIQGLEQNVYQISRFPLDKSSDLIYIYK